MHIFPLARKVTSYKTVAPCKFGYPRNDGRKHGGCDLGAPVGTEVFAIDDGEVVEVSSNFKNGTSVVSIEHGDYTDDDYCVIRYGEVDSIMVQLGAKVKKGDVIAKVGLQSGGTQLHLEMYSGEESGPFLQVKNLPYKRRSDLIDPTPFLDAWQVK